MKTLKQLRQSLLSGHELLSVLDPGSRLVALEGPTHNAPPSTTAASVEGQMLKHKITIHSNGDFVFYCGGP